MAELAVTAVPVVEAARDAAADALAADFFVGHSSISFGLFARADGLHALILPGCGGGNTLLLPHSEKFAVFVAKTQIYVII